MSCTKPILPSASHPTCGPKNRKMAPTCSTCDATSSKPVLPAAKRAARQCQTSGRASPRRRPSPLQVGPPVVLARNSSPRGVREDHVVHFKPNPSNARWAARPQATAVAGRSSSVPKALLIASALVHEFVRCLQYSPGRVVEGLGHAGVVRAGAGAHLYVASMASAAFCWERPPALSMWSRNPNALGRVRVSYGSWPPSLREVCIQC